MRSKLDVRRLWRCPRCGAERKLPADVTSVRCGCVNDAPFMQIVELTRRVRPEPKPLDPYLTLDPDAPEEGDERVPSPPPSTITEPSAGTAVTTDAPQPSPQKREDRRKPRRQRDRQGNPEQPSRNSGAAPSAESPPAMDTPNATPAPTMPSPESEPTPDFSAES
jgi:hypothetical protein